ncbi:F0F1 ATP synthase subunit A [Erythrobacter sp. NFXS35]|uniref:F0F1 ATP synthase subunit A n=1 Tax=unclassified Erythrobacter TaxID=2633097 RepID=UPI0025F8C882|nr:F0F1 ATP synthase subunit A [Erythrobacter sp.]
MKQFTIEPLFGSNWQLADGLNIAFTNSALWMAVTAVLVTAFVAGGMQRQVVPGRWQMAVESMTGFIDDLLEANVGKAGRKYVPYIFTLFMFILFGNLLGLVPVGLIPGVHAFTFTSHFTVTGVLALMSFAIVLVVGFAKHGLHFFSLFVPKDTPLVMAIFIAPIEFVSFMVRPFSLALRLFVAMMAGHVLLKVLASFVIAGGGAGMGLGVAVGVPSFILMVAISALEILVAGIQAYVFALLTSLYINDAENLH